MESEGDDQIEGRQDDASLSTRGSQTTTLSENDQLMQLKETLAALRAEMAMKDAMMAAKRAENAKQYAKIAAMRAEDAQLDAELAKMETMMAAKRAEDAKLDAKIAAMRKSLPSIETTYCLTDSDSDSKKRNREYSQPNLKVNDLVDPHNKKPFNAEKNKKEKKNKVTTVEKETLKPRISHTLAWKGVEDIVIPTELLHQDKTRCPIPSVLGVKAYCCGTRRMEDLEYISDACVQDFVKAQVEDARRCLGLDHVVTTHIEASIFSAVPDVVIVNLNGAPLAFVEVKSPERPTKQGEVYEADDVIRQVFNCLMGFKKIGHALPIGFVSTYNAIAIVTPEDLANNPNYCNVTMKMKEELSTETRAVETVTREKQKSCEKSRKLTGLTKNHAVEDDRDEIPNVFMSDIYRDGQCMQTLLAGILASYRHNNTKDSEKVLFLEENDDLSGLFIPKVSKDEMVWTTIRKGVKASCTNFSKSDAIFFYLLARVSQGSRGKVFLASTISGTICAMKLYVPRRSIRYEYEDRQEQEKQYLEDKEKQRDTERVRWEKLYPDLPCEPRIINGLPALLMVYGNQLEVASDRRTKLKEVEKVLKRFANAGFAYEDSDLRWRDVLSYEGQTLLVDLESLEDISELTDKAKQDRVDTQIWRLEERIGVDPHGVLNTHIF